MNLPIIGIILWTIIGKAAFGSDWCFNGCFIKGNKVNKDCKKEACVSPTQTCYRSDDKELHVGFMGGCSNHPVGCKPFKLTEDGRPVGIDCYCDGNLCNKYSTDQIMDDLNDGEPN